MKCIVKQFDAEIENSNLPVLDLTVANYIKAIGKSEYEDKVAEFYQTLKELDALKYFDAIMPILGDTPSKAVLNLLDSTKYYSYPNDLTVNNNKIASAGSTTMVDGNIPTKIYGIGDWTLIAVFKNPASGTKKIVNTTGVDRISVDGNNYIINFDRWRQESALSANEAYFNSIFTSLYALDNSKFIGWSNRDDDFDVSSSAQMGPETINSYAAINTAINIMAQADTYFVAVANKSFIYLSASKAQAIYDAIASFLSDVKGISIHQNS